MDYLNFAVAHPAVALIAAVGLIWGIETCLEGLARIVKEWRKPE